jgi:aspartate/methionine/tyrosine aminotransferase
MIPRASRLAGIALSPIRAMNEGAPPGTVSLGLGEPGWPLPPAASNALADSGPSCAYGPNQGLAELRASLSAYCGAAEKELMVCAGSQAALFALFHAYLEEGAAALIPDPGFIAYPILAKLAGGGSVRYPLSAGGRLDPESFIKALDAEPRVRLALINHPGNPTGGGASLEALRAVADACRERDVVLLSDEVYRELYLGERPASLRDASDYGIVLSSLSKAFGAPGLRVGWAIGDPELLAPARLIHNYMNTAAARPSQLAAAALLDDAPSILPAMRAELAARWHAFQGAAAEALGYTTSPPDGSFYSWLPLPPWAHEDPLSFCLKLRDRGRVIIIPGLAFGEQGRAYARVSFAGDPASIREGLRRLAPFWSTP